MPVWHVQGVEDLNPHSLRDCQVVGLTAGTSTLDETIDAIDAALRRLPSGADSAHVAAMGASLPRQRTPARRNRLERIPQAQPFRAHSRVEVDSDLPTRRERRRHPPAAGRQEYCRRTGDRLYLQALGLFIKEEQRHAALLERFLRREQTDVIEREWTNGVFRHLRNAMGLELMLSILLAAELMARVYYAALSRATEDPVLRAICRQILRDERWHVQFQCDRLRQMRTGGRRKARLVVRWAERIGFRGLLGGVARSRARVSRGGNRLWGVLAKNRTSTHNRPPAYPLRSGVREKRLCSPP